MVAFTFNMVHSFCNLSQNYVKRQTSVNWTSVKRRVWSGQGIWTHVHLCSAVVHLPPASSSRIWRRWAFRSAGAPTWPPSPFCRTRAPDWCRARTTDGGTGADSHTSTTCVLARNAPLCRPCTRSTSSGRRHVRRLYSGGGHSRITGWPKK